jgi:hypothetical protein
VTLLILLASIAVLEYILHRPDPAPRRDQGFIENKAINVEEGKKGESSEPALDPALFQLGRAVEKFGRGPVPRTHPQSEKESTSEKRPV